MLGRGFDCNIDIEFRDLLNPFDAFERSRGIFLRYFPFLHGTGEVLPDYCHATADQLIATIVEKNGVAALRSDLRDARAHLAGTDDGDAIRHLLDPHQHRVALPATRANRCDT